MVCNIAVKLSERRRGAGRTSIFYAILEVKKDSEDISARIGIFINPIHKNFVRNLMSKLARSTLASPGRIRIKTEVHAFIMNKQNLSPM